MSYECVNNIFRRRIIEEWNEMTHFREHIKIDNNTSKSIVEGRSVIKSIENEGRNLYIARRKLSMFTLYI